MNAFKVGLLDDCVEDSGVMLMISNMLKLLRVDGLGDDYGVRVNKVWNCLIPSHKLRSAKFD